MTTKERPILFSGPMVRALLDGTKTQTRRILKPQPFEDPKWGETWEPKGKNHPTGSPSYCVRNLNWNPITNAFFDFWSMRGGSPYGGSGDRFWVKETWAAHNHYDGRRPLDIPDGVTIECREVPNAVTTEGNGHREIRTGERGRWRPSIFMRRWMSRITLELESVRVERLQEISEEDARAEGVESPSAEREEQDWKICPQCGGTGLYTSFGANLGACFDTDCSECDTHKKRYRHLWELINGPGSWKLNYWVWVVTFRKL